MRRGGHLDALLTPAEPPRRIAVHIERVEISGIALNAAELRRFRGALGAELQRLATQRGFDAGIAPARLPGAIAPAVTLGTPPAQLGRDVARSIYASIGSAG
ncbi:MAG: hypothetical protein KGN16_26475 [Burkholderiales bacterium]|nr:hypothetical protein [Burkholderiales bacterium]